MSNPPSTEDRFPDRRPSGQEVGERHPPFPGQQRPLLTPDDVHHKWFTTVRLREGYDLGEVDSFLLDVEITLDRLYRDNVALREGADRAPAAAQHDPQTARILALADQAAGQALATACAEAGRIVGEAQQRAAHIEYEARGRAERLNEEAVARAGELDRQLRDQQSQLQALTSSRLSLERQLAGLRALVAEYRGGLRVTFDDDLVARLDAVEHRAEAYVGLPRDVHGGIDRYQD